MSEVHFSPCDPDEEPAASLLSEMSAELNRVYANPARLDVPAVSASDLRGPSGIYLVGFDGTDTVAGGAVRLLRPGVGEIKRMYVRPAARSRGVAGLLLSALEQAALALGYQTVRLDTGPKQTHALRLYRASGYGEVEPYNDNPFACYWAEKRLGDRIV